MITYTSITALEWRRRHSENWPAPTDEELDDLGVGAVVAVGFSVDTDGVVTEKRIWLQTWHVEPAISPDGTRCDQITVLDYEGLWDENEERLVDTSHLLTVTY